MDSELREALITHAARAGFDATWRAGMWDDAGNGPRGYYLLLARKLLDALLAYTIPCPTCAGTGNEWNRHIQEHEECSDCDGSGRVPALRTDT